MSSILLVGGRKSSRKNNKDKPLVARNSPQGKIKGHVVKKITKDTKIKNNKIKASKKFPKVLVKLEM